MCCSASRSFRIDGCAGSHCSRLNYHADIETFDATSRTVARQLMKKDALAAHARDELGLTEELAARPLQAALASAATFAVGAAVPILTIVLPPHHRVADRCLDRVADLPCGARRDRRTGGRRVRGDRRRARRILGRTCDGDDGGRRTVIWNCGGMSRARRFF